MSGFNYKAWCRVRMDWKNKEIAEAKAKYCEETVKARFAVKMLEKFANAKKIFEENKTDVLEDIKSNKEERLAEAETEYRDMLVYLVDVQEEWLAKRLAKADKKLKVKLDEIDDNYSSDDESSSDSE
jgi:hypothetical protein